MVDILFPFFLGIHLMVEHFLFIYILYQLLIKFFNMFQHLLLLLFQLFPFWKMDYPIQWTIYIVFTFIPFPPTIIPIYQFPVYRFQLILVQLIYFGHKQFI